MKKTLAVLAVLTFISFSLAIAAPGVATQSGGRGATIGAGMTRSSAAAFDRGAAPQDGTGSKARRGQQQDGGAGGSGDRIRKGDGSCGDQGAQQTRKGNRNGGGKGGSRQ